MGDITYATRALIRALAGIPKGVPVTIDLIRDECVAAGLTSAERSGAFRTACRYGYLDGRVEHLPDGREIHASVKSTHPNGKGRPVLVYWRTGKPIPDHLCTEEFA